jgi:hypothetical protein
MHSSEIQAYRGRSRFRVSVRRTNSITDTGTGTGNTYILPAVDNGTDVFASTILNNKDTHAGLQDPLAANQLGRLRINHARLSDGDRHVEGSDDLATSGGTGTTIASISGATTLNLCILLTHSIT